MPGRLYHHVAERILKLLTGGEFPAGSLLPAERELAAEFGVSRSTVREAVIALEVVGLVDVRVGHGATVLPKAAALRTGDSLAALIAALPPIRPDPDLAGEVDPAGGVDLADEIPPFSMLQARRLIEPHSASLAAKHAPPEDLAAIAAALELNRADARMGLGLRASDRMFHIRIAQASRNPAYERFISMLLGRSYGPMFDRLQKLYAPPQGAWNWAEEHEAVAAAILARDPEAAFLAMERHLDSIIRIYSREVAPSGDDPTGA